MRVTMTVEDGETIVEVSIEAGTPEVTDISDASGRTIKMVGGDEYARLAHEMITNANEALRVAFLGGHS